MIAATFAAVVTVIMLTAAPAPAADDDYATDTPKRFEAAILGGVQGLMENDTALPDNFVNIPLAASFAYHATPLFAVEGEVAWLIPVENSVDVTGGGSADLKNPDVLSYQANLRANLPVGTPGVSPYLTAGLGAMTFLSSTDANNYPQLSESETAFAVNFGLGASFPLTESFSLRGDFREFVAFPQNDAAGLSDGTDADPIWMPRGTVGLSYRF
jgi:opacity protein-like surface antigen